MSILVPTMIFTVGAFLLSLAWVPNVQAAAIIAAIVGVITMILSAVSAAGEPARNRKMRAELQPYMRALAALFDTPPDVARAIDKRVPRSDYGTPTVYVNGISGTIGSRPVRIQFSQYRNSWEATVVTPGSFGRGFEMQRGKGEAVPNWPAGVVLDAGDEYGRRMALALDPRWVHWFFSQPTDEVECEHNRIEWESQGSLTLDQAVRAAAEIAGKIGQFAASFDGVGVGHAPR